MTESGSQSEQVVTNDTTSEHVNANDGSNNVSNVDNAGQQTTTPLTRNQIVTVASLCLGNMCCGTMFAILAPFFPRVAESKGNQSVTDLINY